MKLEHIDKNVRWVSAGLAIFKKALPLQILLVQYRLPNNKTVVEIPKGIVDNGENVLDAAVRETVEETCLDRDDIEIVHSIKPLVYKYMSWLHSFENTGIKKLYVYPAICTVCRICPKTSEADKVFFVEFDKAIQLMTKRQIVSWLIQIKPDIEDIILQKLTSDR